MRKSRFTDEQIVAMLREADRSSVAELVKKIVDVCDRYQRRPATPSEARHILGLRAAA